MERDVPVKMIVPGDVVLPSAEHIIPADGLVIEEADFLASEANATGESCLTWAINAS